MTTSTAQPISDLAVYACCDKCGALARHRVILPTGQDLLFCDHHYTANVRALRDTQPGAVTVDINVLT